MSDQPSAHGPESQGPEARGPESESQHSHTPGDKSLSAPRKRSRLKKILIPAILGLLGVVLLFFGLIISPIPTVITPPASPSLAVSTSLPISEIGYSVAQVSPDIADLRISVQETTIGIPRPSGAPTLQVTLPLGVTFRDCRAPHCSNPGSGIASMRSVTLGFKARVAVAVFPVNFPSFGVSANGLNAYAALPQVSYQAGFSRATPTLSAEYQIPGAASYNWSAFPAALLTNSSAVWKEALAKGGTPGRIAPGINYAEQSRNRYLTFLGGLLIGISGGAIVSAIQEGLHTAID